MKTIIDHYKRVTSTIFFPIIIIINNVKSIRIVNRLKKNCIVIYIFAIESLYYRIQRMKSIYRIYFLKLIGLL